MLHSVDVKRAKMCKKNFQFCLFVFATRNVYCPLANRTFGHRILFENVLFVYTGCVSKNLIFRILEVKKS